MNLDLFKNYFRQRLTETIISVAFFSTLYFVLKDKTVLLFLAAIGLFDFGRGFFSYKKKQVYLVGLAEQELTEQEAEDNSFVVKWEKIRKSGILKYCLIDGAILLGIWMTMFVGFVTLLIRPSFLGAPIEILEFSCPIGVFLGVFLSYFMWSINEKRYAHLIINFQKIVNL